MAAAGFSKNYLFLPRTSLRSYSGVSLISFSPYSAKKDRQTHQGKTKEKYILEGGSRPVLFFARANICLSLRLLQDLQRDSIHIHLFQIRAPG